MNMKQKQFTSLRSSTQEEYGQVQTLCDIIKAANEEKHFKSTQEVFEGISPIMARYIKRGTIGELTRQHIQAGLLNDESLFCNKKLFKNARASLAVRWLRFQACTAGSTGSILG